MKKIFGLIGFWFSLRVALLYFNTISFGTKVKEKVLCIFSKKYRRRYFEREISNSFWGGEYQRNINNSRFRFILQKGENKQIDDSFRSILEEDLLDISEEEWSKKCNVYESDFCDEGWLEEAKALKEKFCHMEECFDKYKFEISDFQSELLRAKKTG